MTQFRRDVLKNIAEPPDEEAHAGLWLEKYLENSDDGSKSKLVREVSGIPTPKSYRKYFARWQKTLLEVGAECREAKTVGRLAVNLGAEGVLETSIALHHTYGTPYIPGSALKGLAAHYVLNYQDKAEWGRDKAFKTLFGDTTSAGYVTFYDALSVPGKVKLVPDVITVHHPDYYQGGDKPPADWDSPTPIPFVTATGSFLIALSGPVEWVKAAFEILELALEREGVGAKTSSGYGRMRFEDSTASGKEEKTTSARNVPAAPPKGADWKKGKISNDGKAVHPMDAPSQRLHFHPGHVLPKGFTPAKKSEVQYLEELLPDGSRRVWVKKMYHPVD